MKKGVKNPDKIMMKNKNETPIMVATTDQYDITNNKIKNRIIFFI